MPDELPDADKRSSGKLVVVLIIVWTAVLLAAGTVAVRKLEADPCWDRGPGHPPPPESCKPK